MIHYTLLPGGRTGYLESDFLTQTPIKGHTVERMDQPGIRCTLGPGGLLHIYKGTVWDYGSGPALNTPAMVRASLVHDAFCIMTDEGLLPWSVRREADNLFRKLLIKYGPRGGLLGWRTGLTYLSSTWRWVGVTAYSQLVARWKRTKS